MDLARALEQFRHSDVTFWGIVALVCCALAVLSANVSALLPNSLLAGLHATRLDGESFSQLRAQIANLEAESDRVRRENALLLTRFSLTEEASSDVTKRVGALEISLPKLLEALPAGADIDRAAVTAALGEGETLSFEAEGGSVSITRTPLVTPSGSPAIDAGLQAMPEPITGEPTGPQPDENAFGIAVGPTVKLAEAQAAWHDLSVKLGPLLFGLGPLLADQPETVEKRIVIGPLAERSEATALCQRLERVGISCLPVPFTGKPMIVN